MRDISEIARIVHEINRLYCEGLGDYSQKKWEEAPQWQQDSAYEGIQEIINNPRITPVMLHVKWRTYKESEGWIYGPVKDENKKTHPCMVDYQDLPIEQRLKDTIFGAVVRGLLGIE